MATKTIRSESVTESVNTAAAIEVPELKGQKDTTWSWMTPQQKKAAFTSSHRGITDADVVDAWNTAKTINGVATILECSRQNAKNRLAKLGLIAGKQESKDKQAAKVAKLKAQLAAAEKQLMEE